MVTKGRQTSGYGHLRKLKGTSSMDPFLIFHVIPTIFLRGLGQVAPLGPLPLAAYRRSSFCSGFCSFGLRVDFLISIQNQRGTCARD